MKYQRTGGKILAIFQVFVECQRPKSELRTYLTRSNFTTNQIIVNDIFKSSPSFLCCLFTINNHRKMYCSRIEQSNIIHDIYTRIKVELRYDNKSLFFIIQSVSEVLPNLDYFGNVQNFQNVEKTQIGQQGMPSPIVV